MKPMEKTRKTMNKAGDLGSRPLIIRDQSKTRSSDLIWTNWVQDIPQKEGSTRSLYLCTRALEHRAPRRSLCSSSSLTCITDLTTSAPKCVCQDDPFAPFGQQANSGQGTLLSDAPIPQTAMCQRSTIHKTCLNSQQQPHIPPSLCRACEHVGKMTGNGPPWILISFHRNTSLLASGIEL